MKLSERDIQRTVVEFMQLDGWRAIRTDPVSDKSRGKGFGEKGMPDYLFLRYDIELPGAAWRNESYDSSIAQVIWVEFKAKGKKREKHQQDWYEREAHQGALVLVVDDIDDFTRWYLESGLNRRIAK